MPPEVAAGVCSLLASTYSNVYLLNISEHNRDVINYPRVLPCYSYFFFIINLHWCHSFRWKRSITNLKKYIAIRARKCCTFRMYKIFYFHPRKRSFYCVKKNHTNLPMLLIYFANCSDTIPFHPTFFPRFNHISCYIFHSRL